MDVDDQLHRPAGLHLSIRKESLEPIKKEGDSEPVLIP
jgi:hypothetical protein